MSPEDILPPEGTTKEEDPVQVLTKVTKMVDELTDAFAFIMDRLDKSGDDPHIEIMPVLYVSDEEPNERRFQVSLTWTHEEP